MKSSPFSRRQILTRLGAAAAASVLPASIIATPEKKRPLKEHSFSFCLNTSTIMGQKSGFEKEFEIAAQAGYDGIEIWIPALNDFVKAGGRLSDLKKKIDDQGLRVENAIGFAQWIVDNNDQRSAALEQAKQEMALLAQIGCSRIAAPPAGATNYPGLNLDAAAERFRALLELGTKMGVIPQLEVWGFSQNLHKLSQVIYVAAECGHEAVRILPDIYHLFKGGSDFDGLDLLSAQSIEIFHMNDYPAEPDRKNMSDADRVYPGDGIGPVVEVLQRLYRKGSPVVLSLELFNRDYWKQDALEVAKTGLAKMKEQVQMATA